MQEPVTAVNLSDIGPVTVKVVIPRPDGKRVTVELKALSEQDIWDIRQSVKWPEPPMDLQKIDGRVQKVYDYASKSYQEALSAANRELSARALLACLKLAVPGETIQDRMAALQRGIGQYAYSLLLRASDKLNIVTDAEVSEMLRSFRANGQVSAPGDAAFPPDAARVAETIAPGTDGDAGDPT